MKIMKIFIATIFFIGISGCISYTSKEETVSSNPSNLLGTDSYALVSE